MMVVMVTVDGVSTGDWFEAVVTLLGKEFAVAVSTVWLVIL